MDLSPEQYRAMRDEVEEKVRRDLRAKERLAHYCGAFGFGPYADQYREHERRWARELLRDELGSPVQEVAVTVADAALMSKRSENYIRAQIRTGKLAAEGEADYRIHVDNVHAWVKCGTQRKVAPPRREAAREESGQAAGERALAMFQQRRIGSK